MKNKYNKFLIVSTIFLLVGGVYLYSSDNLNSGEIVPVAFGAALVSNIPTDSPSAIPTLGDSISSDIAFLTTLVSLKNITMDTSIFESSEFKSLKNNGVRIEPVKPGRINPFAPISAAEVSMESTAPVVVTEEPSDITDKSAVLNGAVNTNGVVTDTYFQYGQTVQALTQIATSKQSLVGTFMNNIIGLTPKTTYFFKACAKINNLANCGDVISFTTN